MTSDLQEREGHHCLPKPTSCPVPARREGQGRGQDGVGLDWEGGPHSVLTGAL